MYPKYYNQKSLIKIGIVVPKMLVSEGLKIS